MLFDNFSTQAAQASLDSLWMQTKVISNNMANVDTPGYKSKHLSFDEALGRASQRLSDSRKASSAQNTGTSAAPVFRSTVMTDNYTSVRVDGNNVSLEREQTELWKTYAQYSYLLDRYQGHFKNINTAITNMRSSS